MAIKAVLGFLISVLVIAIIGGIALAIVNTQRGRKARPGILAIIVGVVGVAILAPLNAGLVLVQPNEAGVVFRQTGSGDSALLEPLQPGLSWVLPFIDQVIIYDVGQQSVTMAGASEGVAFQHSPVRAISSDGQVVIVDATVIYRIDRTKVNAVHRNWRGGFLEGLIIPTTRSEVRNAVSRYGAEQIYAGGRAAMEQQIAQSLSERLAGEGFLLSEFLIRDISFSPEFTDAIERKQIAEQDAQRAAFRVRQAEQEAEQVRVEAQGQADAVVIAAEGEGSAILIRAEADAAGLALLNEVLLQNPALIQWRYINELGDNVQLIILPSNSPFLFSLDDLMAQTVEEPTPVPTASPPPPPAEEETQP